MYGARAEPFELPWPTLAEFPSFGLVRKRADFDELLADRAVQKGATLHEQAHVSGAVVDDRTGRVTGVTTKDGRTFSAPMVVAADGNSSPVARSVGLLKNAKRPMGVACRTYFSSPRQRRRVDGVVAGAVGRQARRVEPVARLRLDLRHGRRHLQRRARHGRQLRHVAEAELPRTAADLAGEHTDGVGVQPGQSNRRDRVGGAADGVQPQAGLRPRAAAGRRLRRHGVTVQRRGHPVRDGGR